MSKLNNAKVRFAEILVASGLNKWKVLNAIGFPQCVGFYWESKTKAGYIYGNRPDDDFRIAFLNPHHSKGEGVFEGADKKRNVGMYSFASYEFKEPSKEWGKGILTVGECKIKVYTFDGYATGWASLKWEMRFLFSDSSEVRLDGGDERSGTSSQPIPTPQPPDYFTRSPAWFFDYYENGEAIIPAAAGWRTPNFLTHKPA